MNDENKIILYQDDNEITRVSVRFADEDLYDETEYQSAYRQYIK